MNIPDLSYNPAARIEARFMGIDRRPLLIIDSVLRYPEQLVKYAVEHGQFRTPHGTSYYPGMNGVLPQNYGTTLLPALRPILEGVFFIPRDKPVSLDSYFGLATYDVKALKPEQCVPHFDSSNPFRVALIHFLFKKPYGGTAFFRHLPTMYESVAGERFKPYCAQVTQELETLVTPQAYVSTETPRYSQIDYVEGIYNRLIAFSTTSLHSGILNEVELSTDPDVGRLTANCFVEVCN